MINRQRAQRLFYILLLLLGLGIASGLILYSLKQNINFFFTPTAALEAKLPSDYRFRLGGQVKRGSVVHAKNSLLLRFTLTDLQQEITVSYQGIPPDLFREGNGAIAEGHWDSAQKTFIATQILAKHDEKYMPRAAGLAKISTNNMEKT